MKTLAASRRAGGQGKQRAESRLGPEHQEGESVTKMYVTNTYYRLIVFKKEASK